MCFNINIDYHTLIDFMKNYSFNAIRIPFSCEGVIDNPIPNSINFYQMNQDLQNLTSLQVLDKMITALGDAGILVLLDMHSLATPSQNINQSTPISCTLFPTV